MATFGYKIDQENVTPKFYPFRNCWRVRVPAAESETGKPMPKYFETEEAAKQFIQEHHRTGSVQLAELSVQERHVLGLIRQSQDYTPDSLLDAWREHQARQKTQRSITIAQLCEAFYARQVREKRSEPTLNDDRWRLNKFSAAIGSSAAGDCTPADVARYLESIPPGTNRRSHFKTLRKLWRWAYQLAHVEADPMARMKPADGWGVNVERLSPELYVKILRVIAGKEPPAKGKEPTTKYKFLLPYFVLAGLAGLRTCELIRYKPGEPVLEWQDIYWNKKLIFISHEVAKATRARDRKRFIPLEKAAVEILRPLAGSGPVMPCSPQHFHRTRRKLASAMRIKFPENCLRNSYATYALTFCSLGAVAKAMGDAEATVKRYYIETLEPGVGHEWFSPKL